MAVPRNFLWQKQGDRVLAARHLHRCWRHFQWIGEEEVQSHGAEAWQMRQKSVSMMASRIFVLFEDLVTEFRKSF